MKYCSECGSETEKRIPEGDNRERYYCKTCDLIHYTNPNIVTGTISVKDDSIILCKRAIEPRYGKWTLPGGFLENGETVAQGAFRETLEETGIAINITKLSKLGVYKSSTKSGEITDNEFHHTYIIQLGKKYIDLNFKNQEVDELKLISLNEMKSLLKKILMVFQNYHQKDC